MGRNRAKTPPKPASAKAGFSLLEVLATLVVTMLLIVTLTPFVSKMLATWSLGGEAAAIVELKTRGLGRLHDDLRHAIAGAGYGQSQDVAVFHGDEASMFFPVAAGLGTSVKSIEYLAYTVENSIDGRALVRRRAPIIGSTYGTFADPVLLISGPFAYVFRYYSRTGEEVAVWPASRVDLPARIELDIATGNGLLLSVPIIIPTFASLSAGCFVDSSLQGCTGFSKANDEDVTKILQRISPPT